MSRKTEAQPLKAVMHQLIEQYRLGGKLTEVKIASTWNEVMGRTISSRTEKVAYQNQTLYVKIDSAPLRQELNLRKEKVITLMNEVLKTDAIKNVVIK